MNGLLSRSWTLWLCRNGLPIDLSTVPWGAAKKQLIGHTCCFVSASSSLQAQKRAPHGLCTLGLSRSHRFSVQIHFILRVPLQRAWNKVGCFMAQLEKGLIQINEHPTKALEEAIPIHMTAFCAGSCFACSALVILEDSRLFGAPGGFLLRSWMKKTASEQMLTGTFFLKYVLISVPQQLPANPPGQRLNRSKSKSWWPPIWLSLNGSCNYVYIYIYIVCVCVACCIH